jgi:TetR/AcrR family transcriptional repressor of nem operon
MARPRRSEQTREALISAGIDQISTHGYHGTGIKQILDIVNVPKGSFYNFFASKEAFVVELVKAYNHNLLDEVQQFRTGAGAALTPLEQIRQVAKYALQRHAQSQCQKSCLIGALAIDVGSESTLCQQALVVATQEWQVLYTQLFGLAQQSKEVRADISAQQLTRVYWSTWEGTLLQMKVSKNMEEAVNTMETVLDVLFRPMLIAVK